MYNKSQAGGNTVTCGSDGEREKESAHDRQADLNLRVTQSTSTYTFLVV